MSRITGKRTEGRGKRRRGILETAAGFVALLLTAWSLSASAGTVLVSDTRLVSGNDSSVFSFQAPGPGTISVQVTNVDWPQPLSSLSFLASTSNHVVTSWSDPASQRSADLSFKVTSPGAYFADVMAQAGGPLNLGVYSLSIQFSPTMSAVPLPGSGWLLLAGLLAVGAIVWHRVERRGPQAASQGVTA